MSKLNNKLSALTNAIDVLEENLDPLFSQSLPDTLLALNTIQQAKLQTVLPYILYDLIFIYLKSRGIDPKTHAVVSELDRIRDYFDKISNAEDPAKRRLTIDKAAAGRFIKHAIAQAQNAKTSTPTEPIPPVAGPSASVRVPVKITSKMLQRAQYEQELKNMDSHSEDEAVLEVWDSVPPEGGDEDRDLDTGQSPLLDLQGEKQKEPVSTPDNEDVHKRRRPPIDPFAGYGDDLVAADPSGSAIPDLVTGNIGKLDIAKSDPASQPTSGRSTPSPKKRKSDPSLRTAKKAKRKTKK